MPAKHQDELRSRSVRQCGASRFFFFAISSVHSNKALCANIYRVMLEPLTPRVYVGTADARRNDHTRRLNKYAVAPRLRAQRHLARSSETWGSWARA
eukprot:8908603-Alexandrium_andersonii.AAC.1